MMEFPTKVTQQDIEYQEYRSEALNNIAKSSDNLIKSWLKATNIDFPVAYDISYSQKVLTLYSNCTRLIVGSKGTNLQLLRQMLKDKFLGDWEIEIKSVANIVQAHEEEDLKLLKTRTRFTLHKGSIITCDAGTARGFAEDLAEFIVPIIDETAIAEFNHARILVMPDDTAETIIERFKSYILTFAEENQER